MIRRQSSAGAAIAARGPREALPGRRRRPRWHQLRRRAGRSLRLARTERRREVDHRQDPDHARARRRRIGEVAGIDVARDPVRVRRTIGAVGQRIAGRPGGDGPREPRPRGADPRPRRRPDAQPGRRAARPVRADRGRRPAWPRPTRAGCAASSTSRWASSTDPSVLFLDEPTTGLDPEARAELWAEIGRLTREDGLTILLTTHYLEEADRLAGRLAIVDRGRIVATGTPGRAQGRAPRRRHPRRAQRGRRGRPRRGLVDRHRRPHAPVVDGRSLRARATHGAALVPAVLSALDAAEIPVASITVARPSLDDVYLRHTGRAFRQQTEESYA